MRSNPGGTWVNRRFRSAAATVALTALMLGLLAVPASAHQDPGDCDSTGVAITLGIFRSDGSTPIGSGTVEDGETVVYITKLARANTACAFEGGTITMTSPSGAEFDATPDGGVPCIGGTAPGCVNSIESKQLVYIVEHGDEATAGSLRRITARTNYGGGVTHDSNPDSAGPTGSSTKTNTVAHADIHVDKTPDGQEISAGDTASFTITVTNGGLGTAENVELTDDLPDNGGLTWTENPDTAECSITGDHLQCSIGDLAPGASFSVTVEAPTGFDNAGTLDNTASASTSSHETHGAGPGDGDNSDTGSIVVKAPGLTITKTADATPVSAGDAIGFTVEVGNNGPGIAKSVTLNDPLPGGSGVDWSIDPAYAGPGSCSITGAAPAQTLECSFGDLGVGSSTTVHVSSATTFDSAGTYDNTATASASNSPSRESSDSIEVQAPALAITKTADAKSVSTGDDIGFTIDVSNAGPGTARNVTLNDPLPGGPGVDWSIDPAYSGPGGCSITGAAPTQTLSCSFGDLAAGASASVHVSSGTTSASAGNYDNTATASQDFGPSVNANDSVVVQAPTLDITKVADDKIVSTGEDIGFTVTVSNGGPGVARSVTLSDPLPGGTGLDWSISPAYAGPGTCAITGAAPAQSLTCSFGDLGVGESASVHVSSGTGTDSAGLYPNTATASTTNGASVDASDSVLVQPPTLTIDKKADVAVISTTQSFGFTITVGNGGPGTAFGATLSDPLPGGPGVDWSINPAYSGPGTCEITGSAPAQSLSCSFGDLAPGASASLHITSGTNDDSAGTYDNTATAKASNAHPVNDSDSVTVLAPKLEIVKSADAPVVSTTQDIGFAVGVANTGLGTAFDVKLSDPLPGGPGVSWSISPAYAGPGTCEITGAAPSQTLSCSFGDMGPGAVATVHLVSGTTRDSAGTYDNTATATAQLALSVSDSDTIVVLAPALDLIKKADAVEAYAGDVIGYSLVLSNAGPGTSLSTVLSDPLPGQADIDWAIAADSGDGGACTVTGVAPTQALACSFGDVGAGASIDIHVVSPTTHICQGEYENVATAGSVNDGPVNSTATINLLPNGLAITQTPDAVMAPTGSTIGFTIDLFNAGPDSAFSASLSNALPGGPGIDWSIDPAYAGPGTCAISGAAPTQTLGCQFGDIAKGDTVTVRVSSSTASDSMGAYTSSPAAKAHNNPVVRTSSTVVVKGVPGLFVGSSCPTIVTPGSTFTYPITFGNAGNAAATGSVLTVNLPSGVQLLDAAGGSVAGSTITYNLGTLDPGEEGARSIKVKATAPEGTTLTNSVTLTGTGAFGLVSASTDLLTLVTNAGAATNGGAFNLDVRSLGTPIVDRLNAEDSTAAAPAGTDSASDRVVGVDVPTIAELGIMRSTSDSTVNETTSTSTATATAADVNLLAGVITADLVKGVSSATSGTGKVSTSSEGSRIENLKINGLKISEISRNLVVELYHPLNPSILIGKVVLQEETSSVDGESAKHSVNMIHVTLLKPFAGMAAGAEIIVSHAESDAKYPTGKCTV